MRPPAALRYAAPSLAAVLGALSARPVFGFPSSRLVYSRDRGAERCPDEDVVRREVASRLGYDPFFPSADRVIIAEVAPSSKGFRATVHLVDRAGIVRGKRELRSPGRDCAELLKSIALAISIAIDPDAVEERRNESDSASGPAVPAQPAQSSAPAAPAISASASDSAPEPAPVPAPRESRDFEDDASTSAKLDLHAGDGWIPMAGAGVRVATGLAPAMAGGGTLLVGAGWRWLAVSLEGTADIPASNDVVKSHLFTGSLVGCAEGAVIFGCVLGSLGVLFAEGRRSDSSTYGAAGARVGAGIPLGRRFALRAYLEATVPVGAEIVLALNNNEVWRLPAVAGAAGTQVVMRFP